MSIEKLRGCLPEMFQKIQSAVIPIGRNVAREINNFPDHLQLNNQLEPTGKRLFNKAFC